MDDVAFLPAVELAALLRERQLSAVELLDATRERIGDDAALNAFADVDWDAAREQAAAVAPGDPRPLAGVPTAVKANTPARGLVMDYGSALLDGHRADHDAHLVRRLREGGQVLVGATTCPEFGILPSTEGRHHGPTRNPWDPGHTPGGSSGGAAAAVAAGLLPVAHANDGGGSIRIPAACCGLVGLKPSRGRVSRGPDSGDSFLVCDGVVSRTVLDTAAALDLLSGYEAGDATWAPPAELPYVTAAERDPGALRVHVVTHNPLGDPVDPRHVDAVEATGRTLAELGHEVDAVEAALPGEEVLPLFETLFGANIALSIAHAQVLAGREAGPEEIEPLSRAMWDRALGTSAVEYQGVLAMLQGVARRVVGLWADCDVMLLPALAQRPPRIGEVTGDHPREGFDRAVAFAPFAGLFNVTGQPAVTVPAGIADDGLPVAVQLVGRPLAEDALLQLARQLEVAAPWRDLRPPAPSRSAGG